MKNFLFIIITTIQLQTFGQIGIGTKQPHPSAQLEIAASNKGLLIPRIMLQSNTDAITIPSPAPYLMLYHTNTGIYNGLTGAGLYVNTGSSIAPNWQKVGQGQQGETGAMGPAGPAGANGANNINKSGSLNGYAGASIAGYATSYVFVGPTTTVTVTATQKILMWGVVPVALAAGKPPQNMYLGAGYQNTMPGSAITNMVGGDFSIVAVGPERHAYAIAGHVKLGAGTYTIGAVVRNLGINPLSNNDYINLVYMVVE
jgi:hypothetical protein